MATFAGKDGALYVRAPSGSLTVPTVPVQGTGVLVAQITNWSLNVAQDMLDTSAFGDEFRNFKGGLRGWSASVECIYDPAAASNQDELWEAVLSADFTGTLAVAGEIQVDLYVDAESAGSVKKVYYGAVFVESADVSTPVADRVTATLRLRGNGALKFTAVGA